MQFSSRPPFVDHEWVDATTVIDTDRPQHNPTNPILECFRADAKESIGTDAGGFIETMQTLALHWLNSDNVGDGYASDAQKEHADRVLARLAKESA